MKNYTIPTIEELFAAGVHYGHQAKKWHPHMAQYIYTTTKDMHIINLEKTHACLESACEFLYTAAKNGDEIIFVGTKKQAKEAVQQQAIDSGAKYVTQRWLGGTITNFSVIKKSINRLLTHLKNREDGAYAKYTKKERLLIDQDIEKLQNSVGGISGMVSKPAALVIIDAKREKTAIREANGFGIPVIALVDTNTSPKGVNYVIPGNDDAVRSISLIVHTLSQAVKAGYTDYSKGLEAK